MRLNAEANTVAFRVTAQDLLDEARCAFDVVLVGDLFYERHLAARVLAYIETAATRRALVLVGDPRRNYFPQDRFAPAACYDVPVTLDLEDALTKPTTVWCLEPPSPG
jgi:predicted nicotinamide N-methyase